MWLGFEYYDTAVAIIFSCWPFYDILLCNVEIHFLEATLFYKHKPLILEKRCVVVILFLCFISSLFLPFPM